MPGKAANRLKNLCAAALAAGLAVAAAAAVRAAEKAPVDIGAIYNLTGAQAGLDGPSARGAELAVAKANAAGGVLGRPIRLILRNGATVPATIARETADILEKFPGTVAFMGLSDSDMVIAAAPVAARAGRAFLTSGATSPLLPGEAPGHLMLACFGDNVQAAAAAEWAYGAKGARTVSVLFNGTMSYTDLLHRYFETSFRELGGRVLRIVRYTPATLAAAVAETPKADILYVAAGPDEAARAVELLRAAGHGEPILGGDGFDAEGAWAKRPDTAGVFFTTHAYIAADNPDPKVTAFRTAFEAAHPGSRPDAFAALGYDTARLLIAAIRAAGSTDPERVRASLGATDRFDGVTGSLRYPPGGYIPTKAVTIVDVEGGRYRLVGRLVPERVPVP